MSLFCTARQSRVGKGQLEMTEQNEQVPEASGEAAQPAAQEDPSDAPPGIAARTYEKTPQFVAMNAARYQRQQIIKAIQKETDRILLCYVVGNMAEIHRDDTGGFVDLLHNIHAGYKVDLLIHTVGGDLDTAEKLIKMVQSKVAMLSKVEPAGDIRVIVPEMAKSAGTLMALGARTILMSDSSELGALDPQVVLKDNHGNSICHSVLRYLAAYQRHEADLRANPNDAAARAMFEKFDPWVVQKFDGLKQRAQTAAEDMVKPRGLNWSAIASGLMDIQKWKSHSQMIGAEDAVDIGLDVEIIDCESPLWQKIWQLYSLQRIEADEKLTLFESDFVSFTLPYR